MQSYRGAKGGVNQAAQKQLLKRNVFKCFLKVGTEKLNHNNQCEQKQQKPKQLKLKRDYSCFSQFP